MRVALAKVLFCEPEILLLDEPTNHLDLDAVMWLQDYLINWDKTVLIVSHARSFLNNVCTDIIHYHNLKLDYYRGNYDNFERVKEEKELQTDRNFEAQQKKMSHVQEFIDKFRYNAKRASMVQSRIKYLNKLDKVEKVLDDPTTIFIFESPEKLRPPIIRIDDGVFGYTETTTLLKDITFTVDMGSKVAILGSNGAGKTTLLKMLTEELKMRSGTYYRNQRARIATFSQHHVDHLDITLSPFEQFVKAYPKATTDVVRSHLSRFGITGNLSLRPMYLLSGGQKARVALSMTAWGNPHVMIMDEPTNHLDIDAVDALVVALNNFTGGLLIVSHDQYFVSCICDQIWYVRDGKLKRFTGDFDQYKTALTTNKL
jgi:ATP-binding cassette, subfamily F, member 3